MNLSYQKHGLTLKRSTKKHLLSSHYSVGNKSPHKKTIVLSNIISGYIKEKCGYPS